MRLDRGGAELGWNPGGLGRGQPLNAKLRAEFDLAVPMAFALVTEAAADDLGELRAFEVGG
jgi:hypothetical protein